MNELVREWIEKAEADSRTTERESRVTDGPNWDAVCFHAQQAVEKYCKALLQDQGIPFPKIHDLSILAKPLFSVYPEWKAYRDSLKRLSLFAVEFRYPGKAASEQDAREALVIMREWRTRLREALKLVR
jgi:HEPN domain-containing protein